MTEIAVGILSEEAPVGEIDPLRDWAISVLQNPSSPPVLTEEAAQQLKFENIGWLKPNTDGSMIRMLELVDELKRSIDEPNATPRSPGDDSK